MTVLDTLKNDDANLRRVGETWMRCSLKSYIRCVCMPMPSNFCLCQDRVLDPILFDLLDPSILRTPTVFKVRGKELPGFQYERPFDQRIIQHLLETLLSIVSFGGQGFAKAARATPIKRSHHSGLVLRVAQSLLIQSSSLKLLIDLIFQVIWLMQKQVISTFLSKFFSGKYNSLMKIPQSHAFFLGLYSRNRNLNARTQCKCSISPSSPVQLSYCRPSSRVGRLTISWLRA